jgi:exonuclease SbcD
VKLLHTSDWHVGKTIKGQSRLAEHRAVLADIVRIADEEHVDAVLVVGDVYETAAPSSEAEALVLQTLLDLREAGTRVVVLSGNHDNAARFEAVRPVFAALDVTVIGAPRRRREGGVLEFTARDGNGVRIALIPFCSQRAIIRSAQLMAADAAQLLQTYDERVRQIIHHLVEGFTPDAVNVVAAHGMITGAQLGGGERAAQTYEDYWIGAAAFPAHLHYVALGHIHRSQQIGGASPIWYCGSPLQVDFGESANEPGVLLMEATPVAPAQISSIPVTGGRTLRTLHGTFEQLRAHQGATGNDFLRVIVEEHARAGLAEDVRDLLGDGVVEVRLAGPAIGGVITADPTSQRLSARTPHELFAAYLAHQGIADPRIEKMFAQLLDEDAHQ